MSCVKFGITRSCFAMVLFAVVLLGGCQNGLSPRARIGAYFGLPVGMDFNDPEKLGNHSFFVSLGEKNGMVYTCNAGFIDIGHVREAADRTAYIARIAKKNLMETNTEFSFRVIEPSKYTVNISYPDSWAENTIEQKEQIAHQASIQMGQFFAHKSLVWHEILTWYGFSSTGFIPESISSFSCEDTYSDLLGTHLAAKCLSDKNANYDKAMTVLLDETLEQLNVQPSEIGKKALKQIDGKWFQTENLIFVDMKKRNFDVGQYNGQIDPVLVDGICEDPKPISYPTPNLSYLSQNDFTIELKLEPNVWQKNKIFQAIGLSENNKYILPDTHFPQIIRQLENQQNKLTLNQERNP